MTMTLGKKAKEASNLLNQALLLGPKVIFEAPKTGFLYLIAGFEAVLGLELCVLDYPENHPF